ncbi:MAG: D-alanyl-D-alanine carboxypeptidase family protein [Candidatus Gastranaerophilales bacterium]|nr:D-alanyl-D-alanine carboxypeptidase family protein [Candidatus Gastranaerophilales bacterium]
MKIWLEREQVYAGSLILVNEAFSLRRGDEADLIPTTITYPEILMRREAVMRLREAFEKADCAGEIVPVSGYRSAAEQAKIYKDSLRDNGAAFTRKYVALPYHSEHQTGLAIDLGLKKDVIDFIRPDFPYDGICGAFRQVAGNYGFVERYPKGKEHITGIAHEPWHFRYVGHPHARIMAAKGLTLEEYVDFVKDYPVGGLPLRWEENGKRYVIFYVAAEIAGEAEVMQAERESPARKAEGEAEVMQAEGETGARQAQGKMEVALPDGVSYQVSGNNRDGFIVTYWRDRDEEW